MEEASTQVLLLVAGIGFLGVVAGGLLTLFAQMMDRKAKRKAFVREKLAALLHASHRAESNMEATLAAIRGESYHEPEEHKKWVDTTNEWQFTMQRLATELNIHTNLEMQDLSTMLCNQVVQSGNHATSRLRSNAEPDERVMRYHRERAQQERVFLTQLSRTSWLMRHRVYKSQVAQRYDIILNQSTAQR